MSGSTREGRTCRWASDESGLDLAVTVRAEEDAVVELVQEGGQCCPALRAELESLAIGIHVVEMQALGTAVIPADGAAAARSPDQGDPHTTFPARDCFTDAAAAPPARSLAAVQGEWRAAVPRARPRLDWLRAASLRTPATAFPATRHERNICSLACRTVHCACPGAWPEGRAADF